MVHKTLWSWITDQFTMFAISFFVGVPIIALTLVLLEWRFPYHWFVVSAIISLVGVFFSDVYPTYLAPLFNTYTKLPEGNLRTEIKKLAHRIDFPLTEVVVVDGSRRIAHSNAFIMGFNKNKQIVLYDTLMEKLTESQILAILGHEMGHQKFNHTWKQLLLQLVCIGNFIFVFIKIINREAFYKSFGFSSIEISIGLVLFSYLYSSISSVVLMSTNFISRNFEYKCDEFAIKLNPERDLETALIKLHATNPSNLMPDIWYSAYHYSHPSLLERLENIKQIRKTLNKYL